MDFLPLKKDSTQKSQRIVDRPKQRRRRGTNAEKGYAEQDKYVSRSPWTSEATTPKLPESERCLAQSDNMLNLWHNEICRTTLRLLFITASTMINSESPRSPSQKSLTYRCRKTQLLGSNQESISTGVHRSTWLEVPFECTRKESWQVGECLIISGCRAFDKVTPSISNGIRLYHPDSVPSSQTGYGCRCLELPGI